MIGKLTARHIRNAKPGRHADGGGLYLFVKPTGARSWVLRVVVNGRRRDFGLGPVDLVSLGEARDKAIAGRKLARRNIDPRFAWEASAVEEAIAAARREGRRQGWNYASDVVRPYGLDLVKYREAP